MQVVHTGDSEVTGNSDIVTVQVSSSSGGTGSKCNKRQQQQTIYLVNRYCETVQLTSYNPRQ